LEYAIDTLKIGRLLQEKLTEKYNHCMWVLYASNEERVKTIKKELLVHWKEPDHDQSDRYDRFCFSQTRHHHLMSGSEFHTPKGPSTAAICKPDKKNYEEYANSIASIQGESDVYFVAKVLAKLQRKIGDPNPPE